MQLSTTASAAPDLSDPRWAQLRARDPSADGSFVYSVRTTGVYCRPSCASRPARPENVRFHASVAEAEAAGFRPCKRCRPDGASPAQRRADAVAKACRAIEAAEDAPPLAALARAAGLSPFHFHRAFKAETGLTPKGYAKAERARRLRDALPESRTVTDALYDAGYGSNGRFYESAGAELGMSPSAFRAGGAGSAIRYAVGTSSLGPLLVAATEAGLCAILMGDDADALASDLRRRFPKATVEAGDETFGATVAAVLAFVDAPRLGLDLPLDIQGTAFQRRVWSALQAIPPGQTATYSTIARRIDAPRSVRAVAGACAANPLAVAVPCHRVLGADGRLSGYRWGVERKRALLEKEGALAGPGTRERASAATRARADGS